ncbi:MAG: hypothetical protein JRJ78_07170 [Deltaproteobacteria bacterium]|nr:hypothetical protein [Deltaproteobacteria bacterium]
MLRDLIIGSTALAMFIICPRMAGMVHIISKHSHASLYLSAFLGSLMAVPFVLLMVFVFARFGIWGALGFCVLTDLVSAFIIKEVSFRAGIETLVIAFFVIVGVKVAPLLSGLASK